MGPPLSSRIQSRIDDAGGIDGLSVEHAAQIIVDETSREAKRILGSAASRFPRGWANGAKDPMASEYGFLRRDLGETLSMAFRASNDGARQRALNRFVQRQIATLHLAEPLSGPLVDFLMSLGFIEQLAQGAEADEAKRLDELVKKLRKLIDRLYPELREQSGEPS